MSTVEAKKHANSPVQQKELNDVFQDNEKHRSTVLLSNRITRQGFFIQAVMVYQSHCGVINSSVGFQAAMVICRAYWRIVFIV
jgi:hypothetical protein